MFAVHRFAQGAADWRSGPRWSIISVLCPVHPFATTWHFPSRGNEKIGGTGYCVTYDTDSQSRNVLASPLGEEGHEVAKGCTRVRMIMILDVDVTAERRHYNTHRPMGDTTTLGPKGRQSSRRNQITLSAPHRTVRAVFPHTALRIVLGVYSLHLISCSSVYI